MLQYLGLDPDSKGDDSSDNASGHPFSKAFPPENGWTVPPAALPRDLVPMPIMCQTFRWDGVWDDSVPTVPRLRLHNDCAYWCFTTNCTQKLVAEGRRYLKIDGLWGVLPLEVLGFSITEPGSAFFSLVHIPVILYLLHSTYDPEVLARVKPGHPFLHPYRWVLVQATVTWSLSTYYHSYHTTWSEHLDYYGANALLLTYLVIGVWRWGGVTAARSRLCIAGAVLLYFAGHVSYMELVYFNYDYNMKLCTLVTGAKFAMWLRVVYRSPHPHRARLVQLFVSLSLMGLLELFDFPPVFSYFDAHALWHACTPVWTWYWTKFLIDDLAHFPQRTD